MTQAFLFFALFSFLPNAQAAPAPKEGWSVSEVAKIPVQDGGRVKPLDSLAREGVLFVSGSTRWGNWEPTELVLSWIADPEAWSKESFIRVGHPDVRRQLLLDPERVRFSPGELLANPTFLQYAQSLGPEGDKKQSVLPQSKQDPREVELRRVFDRIGWFRGILSGNFFRVIPVKDLNGEWGSLAASDEPGRKVRGLWLALLSAYAKGEKEAFEKVSVALREESALALKGTWGEKEAAKAESRVSAEILYNHWRPFTIAMTLYLLAALLFLFRRGFTRKTGYALALTAFLFHIAGFALRVIVSGRPPVTNMYESLVWVSFGAILFGGILHFLSKRAIVLLGAGCAVAGLGLLAATVSPTVLDPGIHPLVPVLRSNYWLTVHVLTITLGYAAFALSLGVSNVTLWHYLRAAPLAAIESLNQLSYRAVQFGVVLLAAGTILGGVWADASWGRFWGWDPKEVWALIALLAYVAILHARFVGWVGTFGFAAWTVFAFLAVVMAWYGVNFVLGAGLHSYGFGGGGLGWVGGFCALQLAYVAWVAAVRRRLTAQSGKS